MAARPETKKGPRIGDAASLWNFTPAPGWTKEEAHILKLCLMKFGVGQWLQIMNSGYLPGKLIQQLNGQTQRLLGQQSLAAFTGLKVDIDHIRAYNATLTDKPRKSGLIIWDGPNPTKQMKQEWQRESKERFGLSEQELVEVDRQLQEVLAARASTSGPSQMDTMSVEAGGKLPGNNHSTHGCSLMECDPAELSRDEKLQLLTRLDRRLKKLLAQVCKTAPELIPAGVEIKTDWEPSSDEEQARKKEELTRHDEDNLKEAVTQSEANQINPAIAALLGSKRTQRGKVASRESRTTSSLCRPRGGVKKSSRLRGSQKRRPQHADPDEAPPDLDAAKETVEAALDLGLQELRELGFPESKATEALIECRYDVERAVDWLFANCN